jgi:hypothetical protein
MLARSKFYPRSVRLPAIPEGYTAICIITANDDTRDTRTKHRASVYGNGIMEKPTILDTPVFCLGIQKSDHQIPIGTQRMATFKSGRWCLQPLVSR